MPHEPRETTPALLRVKTLIWVQSVAGAAFATASVAGLILNRDSVYLSAGALLLLWAFGFIPIHRQAKALRPQERFEGRALPAGALVLWAVLEVVGFWTWGFNPWMGLVMLAHGWLAATMLLRAIISQELGVPIHRPTAAWVVSIAGATCLWYGFILAVLSSIRC